MSSELLGGAQDVLKGNLGGAWDTKHGYADAYTDLGIAKKFGGASVAYGLRDIGAMNGRVCRMRRSADDAERDFSAEALKHSYDWVNGKQDTDLPVSFPTCVAAYGLRKVSKSYTGSALKIRRTSDDAEANVLFDRDDNVSSDSIVEVTVGSTTATTLGDFISGTDAKVTTWYDQSGNSNDCSQTTDSKQPAIASAGSLTNDSGVIGIDFNETNEQFLVATSVSGLDSGTITSVGASVRDATGTVVSASNSGAGNKYFALDEGGSATTANPRNTTSGVVASDSTSGSVRLGFAVTTSATATKVGALGSAFTSISDDYGDDFGAGDLDQIVIGALRTVNESGHFDGRIREVIVYGTDHSSNRFSIEANIANHYDITDWGTASKGFVVTLYDQSGNGNDATAPSDAAEPEIVSDSQYLGHLLFDGSDDVLHMDSALDLDPFSILAVGPVQNDVQPRLVGKQSGSNFGLMLNRFSTNSLRLSCETGNLTFSDGVSRSAGDVILASMFFGAGDTLTGFINGATQTLSSGTPDSDTALEVDQVGAKQAANFMTGQFKELIIFATDVSGDRATLESDIAKANGITLS